MTHIIRKRWRKWTILTHYSSFSRHPPNLSEWFYRFPKSVEVRIKKKLLYHQLAKSSAPLRMTRGKPMIDQPNFLLPLEKVVKIPGHWRKAQTFFSFEEPSMSHFSIFDSLNKRNDGIINSNAKALNNTSITNNDKIIKRLY